MWLPKLDGRRGPKSRAIADAIDRDVQTGARLPPHRDLAGHLGVRVTTITRAYTEAARRGLISGQVGRGTFVRGTEPEDPRDEGPFDLSINVLMPDKEVAVLESRLFQRRVLPWTQLLGYVPPPGHLRHRQAIAAWLAQLGVPVKHERLARVRRRRSASARSPALPRHSSDAGGAGAGAHAGRGGARRSEAHRPRGRLTAALLAPLRPEAAPRDGAGRGRRRSRRRRSGATRGRSASSRPPD